MGYNTRQREDREHYGKDCFVDSKPGSFVPGHSAQQFKIHSHFGIFDP